MNGIHQNILRCEIRGLDIPGILLRDKHRIRYKDPSPDQWCNPSLFCDQPLRASPVYTLFTR
jgi:hypothetical protein